MSNRLKPRLACLKRSPANRGFVPVNGTSYLVGIRGESVTFNNGNTVWELLGFI